MAVRLWTLHPRYLDAQGLVALWRESLLAREVLRGNTIGYRRHPQLARFRSSATPVAAINGYLAAVHAEAQSRGYRFDRSKLGRVARVRTISVTDGQLQMNGAGCRKSCDDAVRLVHRLHLEVRAPAVHPLFHLIPGPIADWELPKRR